MIENNFFIIFIDSILLDRVYFIMYIAMKRSIDCIFVYIKLFLLKFKRVGNEYYCSKVFIKSMISINILCNVYIGSKLDNFDVK